MSHLKDSRVSTPVTELTPLAVGREHKYFLWSFRSSVSVQSEFSMLLTPSKSVAPLTYISFKIAFFKLAILNCAISTLDKVMSLFSKSEPSRVASKNEEPTRLLFLKLA